MKKKQSVERRIIQALREATEKLETNEPFKVTEVRRIKTPDGSMHVFRKTRKRLTDGGLL